MESLTFVLVVSIVLFGHLTSGLEQDAVTGKLILEESGPTLQDIVNTLTVKYDTAFNELNVVVAKQQQLIESLQNDNLMIHKSVGTLKSEVLDNQRKMAELTNIIIEQGKQIKVMETSNQAKSISIKTLEMEMKDQASRCDCYKQSKAPESTTVNSTTINKKDIGSVLKGRARRGTVENEVAFYAYITHNGYQDHLGQNQDIKFDHVVTNIGNGYIPNHGTFIAPVAGTYVFTASLHVPHNSRANFVANGNVVARFYADSDEPTQISQTVVVSLPKGADVSIQNMGTDNNYYGEIYTTFGGFLLYQNMGATGIIG
ncbi:Complement C1q-like protein 4 [Mactra antiquata]